MNIITKAAMEGTNRFRHRTPLQIYQDGIRAAMQEGCRARKRKMSRIVDIRHRIRDLEQEMMNLQ